MGSLRQANRGVPVCFPVGVLKMNVQSPLFEQISTLKNLPSLPHILLKLFEACNREDSSLKEISGIVGKDPSLSARMLRLVNSAYFGLSQKIDDIGQAVVLVGIRGVKNMAVCACVYEAFRGTRGNGIFNLKRFWWHSLRCAFLAREISERVHYGHPDEAFMSGLLHDMGKLVLWVNFREAYEDLLKRSSGRLNLLLEGEARLGATHCEVGAWLLHKWNLQSLVSDPVLYHHESPGRIMHSLPLVQIVYVANALCQESGSVSAEGEKMARMILGLSGEEIGEFLAHSDREALDVARSLEIEIDTSEDPGTESGEKDLKVRKALVQEVKNVSLLVGTLQAYLEVDDLSGILDVASQGLEILFDVKSALFFLLDPEKDFLIGYLRNSEGGFVSSHDLSVSLKMKDSLPVKSLEEGRAMDSFSAQVHSPPMILDEQVVRLLGKEGIFCHPMVVQGESVGVLVLGVDRSELSRLTSQTDLLNVFVQKGALALRLEYLRRSRLKTIQRERIDASTDLARKIIHEVNNPLGIIKNYLKILGIKLAEQNIAQEEIRIINEEIDRVSQLLQELSGLTREKPHQRENVEINALLLDILKLARESLLKNSKIELQLDLERSLPKVVAEKNGLKQVFINLIKNAAEAMKDGGNLRIQTRHIQGAGGGPGSGKGAADEGCVEVTFRDNGPGIPEEIREKLFDPYVGTKGEGHSGLGLSVAHNIIKSFRGSITCESETGAGTVFRIELPVSSD